MPDKPKRPAAGATLPPHRGPGATPSAQTPVDSGPEPQAGADGVVTTKMPMPDREEHRGIHLETLDRARYDKRPVVDLVSQAALLGGKTANSLATQVERTTQVSAGIQL